MYDRKPMSAFAETFFGSSRDFWYSERSDSRYFLPTEISYMPMLDARMDAMYARSCVTMPKSLRAHQLPTLRMPRARQMWCELRK